MNKKRLAFPIGITAMLLILSIGSMAQVTLEKATLIAKNHYWKYSSKKIAYQAIEPKLVQIQKEDDFINYFAFNINDNNGFVIVSGDESKMPIIGYSFKGSFSIPDENSPLEYVNMLKHNSRKPDVLKSAGLQDKRIWEELSQKNFIPETEYKISVVEPLIKSTWGQGGYYNDSIPEFEGSQMPVGCVATAMAQVMNYYSYPPKGSGENFYQSQFYGYNVRANFGQTEYQWENIPNNLTEPNPSVAQLNYHVAVAVNMSFYPIGSASYDIFAKDALFKYFNYAENINIINTDYYDSIDKNWSDSIKNEIDNSRPVIIGADHITGGGHAFICDGRQDNYFHFNFGWDGMGDGYFYLSNINGFNNRKSFLTNVKPPVVGYAVDKLNPFLDDTISIEILTKEDITNIQWSFYPEDFEFVHGTNASSRNPEIIIKKPGQYSVSIKVEANGKSYNVNKTNYINAGFKKVEQFNTRYNTANHQSLPVKWFDFDNDGDLDIIQSVLSPSQTKIYENINGNFLPKNQDFPGSYDGCIATFDYNNNGLKDIFIMGGLSYIKLFRNLDGDYFKEKETNLPQLSGGTIIPGDYNNDGWVDLFIAGKDYNKSSTTFFYYLIKNEGGNFIPVFSDSVTVEALYQNDNIADFADFDNDGDLDIAIHEVSNEEANCGIRILYNNDSAFVKSEYLISGTGYGAITCSDFDNDGDVDILSASKAGISILNNENSVFVHQSLFPLELDWIRLECNDLNFDGYLDLHYSVPNSSRIYYADQTGSYNFNNPVNIPNEGIGIDSHLGDYNNDGRMDIIVGNEIFKNYQNAVSHPENKVPTSPTELKHEVNDSAVVLIWKRSEDRETPEQALSYNIMVGTSTNNMNIVNPNANINTGKRKIVKLGNVFLNDRWTIKNLEPGKYYWSVQAIDNSYEGGLFAPVDSFEISESSDFYQITYEEICENDSVFWRGNYYKTEGQFFEKYKTTQLRDSIYELNVSFFQKYYAEERTICEGDSILWEEQYYKSEGIFEKNFISENSCDSIRQLSLLVYLPDTTRVYATICDGGNYLGYTKSGTYFLNGATYYNCTNINQLELTVNPGYEIYEEIWLCENKQYNGWTLPGNYTRKLTSTEGCDSIVYTSLNFFDPMPVTNENITICEGDNYIGWTDAGIFERTIELETGCDSIVTTYLTVLPPIETVEDVSICLGENYHGWSESGNFSRTISSVSGCDSIIYTELTVLDPAYNEENITICFGDEYLGYFSSGVFQRKLRSENNCDSIVITHLTVLPINETTQNITICEGEVYGGWYSEGQYIETYDSNFGCDSTVITNLFFYPNPQPEIFIQGDTLKSDGTFISYQWLNKDGEILGAVNSEYVISASGEYFLNIIDKNGCAATSELMKVVYSAASQIEFGAFQYSIIPNPNNGKFSFRVDSNPPEELQLKLMNSLGQVVETRIIKNAQVNYIEFFDVSHLEEGVYFLKISNKENTNSEKIIVTKHW